MPIKIGDTYRGLDLIQLTANAVKRLDPSMLPHPYLIEEAYLRGLVTIDQVVTFFNNCLSPQVWNQTFTYYSPNFLKNILTNTGIDSTKLANVVLSNPDIAKTWLTYLDGDTIQTIMYNVIDNVEDVWTAVNTVISIARNYYVYNVFGSVKSISKTNIVVTYRAYIDSGAILDASGLGADGGSPGSPPGRGGNGGGGIIIVAIDFTCLGTIRADGEDGESGASTSVKANGSPGGNGRMIIVSGYGPGDGGSNGSPYGGNGGKPGGGGGGGTSLGVGGDGGNISLVEFDTPDKLVRYVLKGIIDSWILSIGKTLTASTDISIYGAGGGGGGDEDTWGDHGGGGGSGGQIIIIAENVDIENATFTAKGGNGGNGGAEGAGDAGGNGGGGGVVYIFYRNAKSLTYNIDVSGGGGGTCDFNGTSGTSGSYLITSI